MLASAIGGGGIAKGADLLFGRKAREVSALGDTIKTLSDQLDRSDARQKRTEERVDDMEEKHELCESRLRTAHERIDKQEREIARLMAGDVPPYQAADLKRVGGKTDV